MAECVGHRSPFPLDWLAKAVAPLADLIAERAPTAAEEMQRLRALAQACGPCGDAERWAYVRGYMAAETVAAARHVAEVTRNTEFLRRYRELTRGRRLGSTATRSSVGSSDLSADEVLEIVDRLALPGADVADTADDKTAEAEARADAADGFIGFLTCMTSLRARNVHEHMRHLRRPQEAFGVDVVLGAMVDFDYWIDCPPRSPQKHQFELHAMLCQLHGGYLRPLVSYNPWTDILEQDASLKRVCKARACGFVGAKIYPAIGFMPANNASTKVRTSKRRPDLNAAGQEVEASCWLRARRSGSRSSPTARPRMAGTMRTMTSAAQKVGQRCTRVTRGRPTPRWSASGTSAAWLRSRPGPGSSPSS